MELSTVTLTNGLTVGNFDRRKDIIFLDASELSGVDDLVFSTRKFNTETSIVYHNTLFRDATTEDSLSLQILLELVAAAVLVDVLIVHPRTRAAALRQASEMNLPILAEALVTNIRCLHRHIFQKKKNTWIVQYDIDTFEI